jgi:phage-related protein
MVHIAADKLTPDCCTCDLDVHRLPHLFHACGSDQMGYPVKLKGAIIVGDGKGPAPKFAREHLANTLPGFCITLRSTCGARLGHPTADRFSGSVDLIEKNGAARQD